MLLILLIQMPLDILPKYACTNESLEGIIQGLDANSRDEILAIGGSGDQAFALLDRARKVKVIDISSIQLDYIKRRHEALARGDFEEFLEIHISWKDSVVINFFKERFENIKGKAELIEIPNGPINIENIDRYPDLCSVNKVYLSNCFGFILADESCGIDEHFYNDMRFLSKHFETGTVFYNAATPMCISRETNLPIPFSYDAQKSKLVKEIGINEAKTRNTTSRLWNPGIFIKV